MNAPPFDPLLPPRPDRSGAPGSRIHMIGIGGVGMAGLARLLLAKGYQISGSDMQAHELTAWLRDLGAIVHTGHAADHVPDDAALVIESSAIPSSNPERRCAKALGIPVSRRGLVLAELLRDYRAVAVSGTHGKTTTTAMIAHLLSSVMSSPDAVRPTVGWCVGGVSAQLGELARPAGEGGILVAEADESDGTLTAYTPAIGVVTNIEFDHMETFASEAAFLEVFDTFAARSGQLVVSADCPRSRTLHPDVLTFGFAADADMRAADLELSAAGSTFRLVREDIVCRLRVPGRYNVMNALGALAVARLLDLDLVAGAKALESFSPVERRFQTLCESPVRVISDYAHHPTAIRGVLTAARALKPAHLTVVFQPHRYTRTRALRDAFVDALTPVEDLWIAPVYAASESPLEGGSHLDLLAAFPDDAPRPKTADSLAEIWHRVRPGLATGHLLLVIGAGDVEHLAFWAADLFHST